MERVALYLQDKHPIRDGMEYAVLAERAGFEAVWQAESRLVREATVPMAAFAAVTERIGIGAGVVVPRCEAGTARAIVQLVEKGLGGAHRGSVLPRRAGRPLPTAGSPRAYQPRTGGSSR